MSRDDAHGNKKCKMNVSATTIRKQSMCTSVSVVKPEAFCAAKAQPICVSVRTGSSLPGDQIEDLLGAGRSLLGPAPCDGPGSEIDQETRFGTGTGVRRVRLSRLARERPEAVTASSRPLETASGLCRRGCWDPWR